MVIVVPPHTTAFWLKAASCTLASKYSDVVVLGPVEGHLREQLIKYKVPILEPPVEDPKPPGWWPEVKRWWSHRSIPVWDPWDLCDVVLILWDHSSYATEGLCKANVRGKKIWFIKMTDNGPIVELPMKKP